ncbi:WS/DGAT domain-containing protein [Streptomyces sp. B1866]|uniref:WS/DGAT domain-containing protein n=1 Tax=Streptomyces sp. B1866 TaxID=3075431 RepID=UPI00288EF625|nr:WS/DGAT domain-containing protein [Streptomyces sp. B1866]MDT3399131.1 WS/DGAT domain-containing protein [Streptomyces sp. B1866]
MNAARPPTDGALRASFMAGTMLGRETAAPDPADVYTGLFLRMRGPAPSLETLRAWVADRIADIPVLTHRPVWAGGRAWWEPVPDLDVARHVLPMPEPDPAPRPAHALLGRPEDAAPRWRLWLHGDGATGWALTYLTHHGAQDGTAVLCTLDALLGPLHPARHPGRPAVPPGRRWPGPAVAAGVLTACDQMLGSLVPAVRRPLPDPAGRPRPRLAHAAVDLALLRGAARAADTTVNAVYLAALAGALRDWGPGGHAVRPYLRRGPYVLMPVDFRRPGEPGCLNPGDNRFAMLRVPLPCADPDPAGRLLAVGATLDRRRLARRRAGLRVLTEHVPEAVAARLLARTADPARVAMAASYLRVPAQLTALGARIEEAVFIPWLPPRHVCLCILGTHRGTARLSALADPRAGDPERLVRRWAREVADLPGADRPRLG